jgi:hypothetical protein
MGGTFHDLITICSFVFARSRHHNMNVSWLRKTEYISTEYNRFMQKSDKSEAK